MTLGAEVGMKYMPFEDLYMSRFCKKWASYNPVSLHSSNPQPLTVGELQALIQENILEFPLQTSLGYGEDQGRLVLREALSQQLYSSLDADNIMTCAGAQEGIFVAMQALLKAGDNVIAFTPVFEPLIATARELGCHLELLELDSENQWKLDLSKLAEVIDDDTQMVIINYPHNPTGALLSKEELQTIIDLCRQHNVWLFSDEVFRGLEYNTNHRLPTVAESYEKGISLGVLSKAYGLPAIRVGWLVSMNKAFIQRCIEIKGYLSICNDQLGEMAAIPVIKHSEVIFENHRQRLTDNVKRLEKLKISHQNKLNFSPPKAGCTVFVSINKDSEALAELLVKQAGLLVIPHKAFCMNHNGFRLGFGAANFDELNTKVLSCL